MAKTKNVSNLALLDIIKVFYSFRVFENKIVSKTLLSVYSGILLLLLGAISIAINHISNYSPVSDAYKFFSTVLGYPVLFLFLFGVFYLVLNSFEDTKKRFLEMYLISSSIMLTFLLLVSLFDFFAQLLINDFIVSSVFYVIFFIMIYFIVSFIGNMRYYFNTSYSRILVSLIVLYIFLFSLIYPALSQFV